MAWGQIRWSALLAAISAAASGSAADIADRPLPELEFQADTHLDEDTPAEEEDDFTARERPWSLTPWIPLNWRSNLALAPRNLKSGLAFEPEAAVGRSWTLGRVRLKTDASAFVSLVPSGRIADASGWWLTGEATTGDPAQRAAPYASYEPLTLHDGVFGARILTFHTITAGIRRAWGPTHLNLFVRRRDATIDALDRTLIAVQLSHSVALAGGLSFNMRADAEGRRYDQAGDIRRRDLFVRARARLFIPVSDRASLVLSADVQRNESSNPAFRTTQIVVGPALSTRFPLGRRG